jgi:capsid assembly protease
MPEHITIYDPDRLSALRAVPWALWEHAWPHVLRRARRDQDAPGADAEAKLPKISAAKGVVAVVPIQGVIVQHSGDWSGDVSTEWIGRTVDTLQADPSIGGIVLNIDSPGGSVYGVPELGEKLRAYREAKAKPIYAVANAEAFSAAYWLASQASRLIVTPSGKVGSIGVWTAHIDASVAYEEKLGLKVTLVSAGKYKVEGHPFGPLDDDARAELQASVDHYYAMFLDAVAAGRGVKVADVRANFGEGRTVRAEDAKRAGMVDGIGTLDDLLATLARQAADKQKAAAEIEVREVEMQIEGLRS